MWHTVVPKTRKEIIFLTCCRYFQEKIARNNIQIFFFLAELIYCGKQLDLSFLPLPSQYHARSIHVGGGSLSGCICVSVHFPKYDLQQKKKKRSMYRQLRSGKEGEGGREGEREWRGGTPTHNA